MSDHSKFRMITVIWQNVFLAQKMTILLSANLTTFNGEGAKKKERKKAGKRG